ncbi:C40 family peptidase [Streptomyces crystallinus]|uniref:C40 family peptidase n=1 Tax=Streptomyces crystallinus TaxID=68191 RepID=A0ABP3RUB6_9ACTN
MPLALVGSLSAAARGAAMADISCATGLGGSALTAADSHPAFGLSAEQTGNAKTIIATGDAIGVPVRGQVVAIATALQESGLRNLSYGDRDSLGLFQQRPSQGWGTVAQIMDPVYSARKFYEHLLKVRGWQSMPVTVAAQAVQRSGFPTAYARHESTAVNVVASLRRGGVQQIDFRGCTPVGLPPATQASGYVAVALQQVGKPYEWGATGPHSFDCSGLIVYAWRRTGYDLSVRTSQEMYNVSVPVRAGQERTGDLIFSGFGRQGTAGPGHVLIVVRPGVAVEAPRTGLDVRVRAYDPARENLRFGRLPRSQMRPTTAQV